MAATMPTATERAWAAGLFEGEGCFSLCGSSHTTNKYPRAILASTDEDVVRTFHRVVGMGSVFKPAYSYKSTKLVYRWQVSGFERVQFLVCLFWEHLHQRRKERATEILSEHHNHVYKNKGRSK